MFLPLILVKMQACCTMRSTLRASSSLMLSLPAKAVVIPKRSTQHCVKRVGKVTGSMLHRHCVWIKRRSSLWIPLTLNKFCMVFIMVQKPLSVVTVL
ncbi:Uncharacterised protein [Vibrio cholerae]|nr:Uncharacterised protein [Vibrio cholerae]